MGVTHELWARGLASGLLALALLSGCNSDPAGLPAGSGPPDHIIWLVEPQATVVSQQPMAEVDIAIVDKNGRTVDTSSAPVSLWVTYPPPDTSTIAPSGQSTVAAVQGVARFTNLSVSRAGHVTMWAGALGCCGAQSAPFDVLPGAPSRFVFTSPLGTAKPGRALPPVAVAVTDVAGNAVTSALDVTVALGANAASAAITGTLTQPTVGSTATFTDLTIDQPGTGYTLTATSGALAGTSPAFDLLRLMGSTASFSAGDGYTCATDMTLVAFCWGVNDYAQLGSGSALISTVLTWPVAGAVSFASISGMNHHSCGLLGSGEAYCWGYNSDGRIGDGTTVSRTAPTIVSGGLAFASISAGGYHTCAVTMAGDGYCWGFNDIGQLGNGTIGNTVLVPVLVAGGHTWKTISTGLYHDCGLTTAGEVYCWGFGDDGALGDGTATTSTVPVKVAGSFTYTAVSAGWDFSCAIASTGDAYCWGANPDGELGDGTFSNRSTPMLVGGGHAFTQISTGYYHTCGVASGGAAYCWGSNHGGQLGGDPRVTSAPVPRAVLGGLTFLTLDAGTEHTCGVTSSQALFCWGLNAYGELGDGTTARRNAPVSVLP